MNTKKITIALNEYNTLNELGEMEKNLINQALKAADSAYALYSGFRVGVALQLNTGEIICGNNQENAAYPSGLCAERVAAFYANANFPDNAIRTMAIVAKKDAKITVMPIVPCGACLQVLLESEKRFKSPIRLIMAGEKKIVISENVQNLLPLRFDSNFL